jgi:hypothetical protein
MDDIQTDGFRELVLQDGWATPTGDTMRDVLAPDGEVDYGSRLVRKGGRLKFNGCWYQDDRLIPYVGQDMVVECDGYMSSKIIIWYPEFGNKKIMELE